MSRHPDSGTQRPGSAAHPAPAQLYALRLRPAAPQPGTAGADSQNRLQGLQGEVEHVLSGARCAFRDTAALVAWLQGHLGTAAQAPGQTAADQAAGPSLRDATM